MIFLLNYVASPLKYSNDVSVSFKEKKKRNQILKEDEKSAMIFQLLSVPETSAIAHNFSP